MNVHELPLLGSDFPVGDPCRWEDLPLLALDRVIVQTVAPGSMPSEIQERVLRSGYLDGSRRHLLVAGPTNSGKSLIGYLAMFRALRGQGRVLLLEPLRSIAEEKRDELEELALAVEPFLGRRPKVDIVTGDYQLNQDSLQSPPPDGGEIIVATPERIEGVMRNPDFEPWVQSFFLVCVDEAHLVGDPLRGACLEFVITSLLTLPSPPRLLLMSATLGETGDLLRWLEPCDTISSEARRPALSRAIVELEDGEGSDVVVGMIRDVLAEPANSVLIFVYQKSSADKLARDLTRELGAPCGRAGARSFHAGLSRVSKRETHRLFLAGECRCVVTTTALAMGVNLPATHVIIRDLCRHGEGRIPVTELVQMSGRAGRGNRSGRAVFVVKPNDDIGIGELGALLRDGRIERVRSRLLEQGDRGRTARGNSDEPACARALLSLLARRRVDAGWRAEELETFFGRTLAGTCGELPIQDTVRWLTCQQRKLAHEEAGSIRPTSLGLAAARSGLPLETVLGLATLLRDLMSVDSEDRILLGLSPLDVLLLLELIASRDFLAKRFGTALAERIDQWMDRLPERSLLYTEWVRGREGSSKASELLGSLGVKLSKKGNVEEEARKVGYLAALRAFILRQRTHGVGFEDLERTWQLQDLAEVEDGWKADRLHLLNGLVPLLDLKCFYFHLKEHCDADQDRVLRVKRALQRIRVITYQLRDLLSWCHPLGPVFVRLRQGATSGARPGLATMVRLEEAGVKTVAQLRAKSLDELITLGIRRDLAAQIVAFLRR